MGVLDTNQGHMKFEVELWNRVQGKEINVRDKHCVSRELQPVKRIWEIANCIKVLINPGNPARVLMHFRTLHGAVLGQI